MEKEEKYHEGDKIKYLIALRVVIQYPIYQ
jgi:hypothetical protein